MGHSEVSLGIEEPPPARCQQLFGRLAKFRLYAYRSEWNSFEAGFAVLYQNEEERPDSKRMLLCALSYVWCCSWGALFAAFRRPAHRTTPRPEAFRGRSDRDEKEFPWSWATISPLPPNNPTIAVGSFVAKSNLEVFRFPIEATAFQRLF